MKSHSEFSKWLMHDDQKELFQFLFAGALNIVFLALVALLLWPLGKASMAWSLAKGFLIFWVVIHLASMVLGLSWRFSRVDIDSHLDAFVISSLAVSGFLLAGWSAFAALTVRDFAAGATAWTAAALYIVGFLSSYIAYGPICAYYIGSLYRLVNLPLSVVSFIVFGLWPAAGRAVYGWFFNLF